MLFRLLPPLFAMFCNCIISDTKTAVSTRSFVLALSLSPSLSVIEIRKLDGNSCPLCFNPCCSSRLYRIDERVHVFLLAIYPALFLPGLLLPAFQLPAYNSLSSYCTVVSILSISIIPTCSDFSGCSFYSDCFDAIDFLVHFFISIVCFDCLASRNCPMLL